MVRVFQVMERVLGSSVTVLVQGETGTGKELIAEGLHFNGPRRDGNFIPVNCGAIPENLLESELFGHRKGSFTGADRDHVGLVEAADGGTLFLDEIAELPLPLQVKLLRFLQEGKIRRIGENTPRPVDVRIVTASHRDLREEIKGGRFREDLYYRINVVTIDLPPLRDRGDDILLLADHFLEKVREEVDRPGLRLGREARRLLLSYRWPGNVRELENAIERAANLALGEEITPDDLYLDLKPAPLPSRRGTLEGIKDQAEERAIRDALGETGGNVTRAAKLLGVSRQHVYTRLRALGIERSP
jgi:DNA-binding NtrC family response regulator